MSGYEAMAALRRDVHEVFALPCRYTGPGEPPRDLSVRFHDKNRQQVSVDTTGWATIMEGVTRVVFNREELADKNVTPRVNGKVYFWVNDLELKLVLMDPYDGPVEERWTVAGT